MKIREAKIEDVDKIAKIMQEVQNLHVKNRPDIFKCRNMEEARADVMKKLNLSDMIIIVAEENEEILGIAICKIKEVINHINLKDAKVLSIDELGVKSNSQRKGIGKLLINKAKNIAKEKSCNRLELNCWKFNSALEFYKKVGFEEQRTMFEMKV